MTAVRSQSAFEPHAARGIQRVCAFCVMDESVTQLRFDELGRCECCRDAVARMPHEWWPNAEGQSRLAAMVSALKLEGRGRSYDAMIGLSGGVDSAYLAHIAVRKLGLRVLAVHVDGGWNSASAVHNIESIVRKLDLDLHTVVVEWQEMKDVQLAFLRARVFNQDMPQDHAFFSTLYRTAIKNGVQHFLSGVNFSTENIVPPSFGHSYMDLHHLRALHQRFGRVPLRDFPSMSLQAFVWHSRVVRRLKVQRPLNYIDYNKDQAKDELAVEYGWRDYGGKHDESRFTKFYQDIYLLRKYGFDKRRLHLSSLIVSGQLTRDEALAELEEPLVTERQAARDIRFVAKKLGTDVDELNRLIDADPIDHLDYPNHAYVHRALSRGRDVLRLFERKRGRSAAMHRSRS